MIGSNLVVEGVPGNPHHHHHHHHHPHHHALAAAAGHPMHNFGAIHHLNPNTVASGSHLMSAATFAENSFLKAAANGSLLPTPTEFLRPLPKPAPIVAARYNGVTNTLNGSIKSRHPSKYPPDTAEGPGPVNLVHQLKEPASSPDSVHAASGYSIYSSPRLYPPPGPSSYPHFPPPPPPPPPPSIQSGPYGSLYPPNPFTPMLQRDTRSTHLLQLQQYPDSNTPILKSPPTPTSSAAAVVTSASSAKSVFETPPPPSASPSETSNARAEKRPFKVPSGKEGSLKHRLLSRPETRVPKKVSSVVRNSGVSTLLPPPVAVSSAPSHSNGLALEVTSPTEATFSLPQPQLPPSATTTMVTTSSGGGGGGGCCVTGAVSGMNGPVSNNFSRGSLIQLANGDLKKVEDMQTEDFLSSAEKSSTMRIDPSTVVRIGENASCKGIFVTLTLSYGEQRHQVDYETPVEHPYFVFEHGWSSCAPEKTFKKFGLQCRRLQVGDVFVSLSRRHSQQSGSQTSRKSGAPKSESTASKLRRQGHGHDEHATQAQAPSRNDNQASNGVRIDAANGTAGGGGGGGGDSDNGATISHKKNDLKIDSCNENNGLRFNHTNGDNNIDSNCSSSSSSSSSNSNSISSSNSNSGSISNTYVNNNCINGGMNFTLNPTNRHAADEEGRKHEKLENDTNNNSNNMSDKYGGVPNKKKRRWSAPDQITDEYQNSPLSSPQSMSSVLSSTSSVGSDVTLSARNV